MSCRQKYQSEGIVCVQNEAVDCVAVLLSGSARVSMLHDDGRELQLRHLESGDYYDALVVLGVDVHPYSLICSEGSEMLLISLDFMRSLLHTNGNFSDQMRKDVCSASVGVIDRLQNIVHERAPERILRFLRTLQDSIDRPGNNAGITPRMTHKMIADNCGLTRETVSRSITQLQRSGRLKRTPGGHWKLLDEGKRR